MESGPSSPDGWAMNFSASGATEDFTFPTGSFCTGISGRAGRGLSVSLCRGSMPETATEPN